VSAAEGLEPPFPDDEQPVQPVLRTCDKDGTHHFSALKHLAKSGKHYLHACNTENVPTKPMRLGTIIHFLLLGARQGAKKLAVYDGRRAGKDWEHFKALHEHDEIVSAAEWLEAEACAEAVRRDPVAQRRLAGARFEVPIQWEEGGLRFSTSGIDIVSADGDEICDLKATHTVEPDPFMRHAFRQYWPMQVAFYRRGARANGMRVSRGLFLLGVETKAPHDVVELELSEEMIDLADRTVSLWLEKLRNFRESNQWPGYAQASVVMPPPAWHGPDDDEDEGDEAA
jgi:hypothetical protein